jgi:site-specific DNA-methyltransferase (adenine-specific)
VTTPRHDVALGVIHVENCMSTMSRMPDGYVHCVVTSPPYNVGVGYDVHADRRPFDEHVDALTATFKEAVRILAPGGHLAIEIGDAGIAPCFPVSDLLVTRLHEVIPFGGRVIWDKSRFLAPTAWGSWCSANKPRVRVRHEYVLIFRKDGDRRGKSDISRDEFMAATSSVWQIKPETAIPWHPAPFPEELAGRLVRLLTFPGERVYDPFTGSGTIPVVCERLGRRWIGSELSPDYAAKATERIRTVASTLGVAHA